MTWQGNSWVLGQFGMNTKNEEFPCRCCGYQTFCEPSGAYEFCKFCGWQDDISQLQFPTMGGANRPCLIEAHKNVVEFGYSIRQRLSTRRQPEDGQRDPAWRTIDLSRDYFEQTVAGLDYGLTYPVDPTAL
jgi:hypothetical protein